MTGADSPVMADSSTEATPSMISPSPGMNSPADTSTRSPLRRLGRHDDGFASCRRRACLATVSVLRLAQRVGLRLAAPFGHRFGEVREEHREPEPQGDLEIEAVPRRAATDVAQTASSVVTTLPDLDDEHDRVLHHPRGLSFMNASPSARAHDLSGPRLKSACVDFAAIVVVILERLSGVHQQVLDDRPEAQHREERQRADDEDHADEQAAKSGVRHGNVPSDGGTTFLRRKVPAIASIGMIIRKRPTSIATPSVVLYQSVFALRPANAEPLLPVPT